MADLFGSLDPARMDSQEGELRAARANGFTNLAFKPSLERLYRAHVSAGISAHFNMILLWGFLLFHTFLLADYLLVPDGFWPLWQFRIGLMEPLFLFMYGFGRKIKFFRTHAEMTVCGMAFMTGLSDIPLLIATNGDFRALTTVLTGYAAIAFFAQGFMGVRFRLAAGSFVVGILSYAPFFTDKSFNLTADCLLSYMSLGVIVATAALSVIAREVLARHAFIGGCLLQIEGGKLKEAQENLKLMAETDGLTGLFNRRAMEKKFDEVMDYAVRAKIVFSVILLDVDFFKLYNDTYGHGEGDTCLQMVAESIQTSLARPLDMACRYGGEEFLVILPSTDEAGAKHVAENIRRAVEGRNMEHAKSSFGKVTVSVGVFTETDAYLRLMAGETKQQISKSITDFADMGLYRSKQNGRNQVTYYQRRLSDEKR